MQYPKKSIGLAALLLAFSIPMAAEAAWPERPITLVAPYPPGGNADILARLVASQVSDKVGQPIVVENKPGAGGMLGSQYVARAKPDGYTFLLGSIANVLNEYFYKEKLLDTRKDLAPVSQLVSLPNYLAVAPNSRFTTVSDILKEAKANPEKVTCATTGVGTSTYLSCELLNQLAHVRITNVPYKGGVPAITDTMGGQTTFVIANEALPYIGDNRLKGLAVTSSNRSPLAPELPPVADTVPNFNVSSWYGVFAPAGTSPDILQSVSEIIANALKSDEVKKKLALLGANPVGSSPAQFKEYIEEEFDRWEKSTKAMNIAVN